MNQLMKQRTQYMVRIGIFSALAFVVMLFEFFIGFAPFLKLDLSSVISIIGGITLGPIAAVLIELVKNLLKVVIITRTAGIGELASLIIGVAYALPATYSYHRLKKSNSGLAIGLAVGSIMMVIIACFVNYFVLLPLWWTFVSKKHLTSTAMITYIQTVILPFNVIKAVILSIVSFGLHLSIKSFYKYIVRY